MIQVLKKEINNFFNSPAGYMVVILFLVGIGLFMWVFPQTSVLEGGFANLDALFSIAPYVYMFLIPAITMRSLAEEKKAGTIELLFTRPLTDRQIIVGKFLACWLLVVFSVVPTFIYYFSVGELGLPAYNIDSAAVVGSYIGLILLGGVFTAIGIFASSLTDNQIVAFIVAVFLCFLLYDGFSSLSQLNLWSNSAYVVAQLGIDYHYESVSKGLLDSRNLLYFGSLTALMLYLTQIILGSRKW